MPVIEQLGSFDPIPNQNNEKLVSLNYERIRHWIGNGAHVSTPVEQLFGQFVVTLTIVIIIISSFMVFTLQV